MPDVQTADESNSTVTGTIDTSRIPPGASAGIPTADPKLVELVGGGASVKEIQDYLQSNPTAGRGSYAFWVKEQITPQLQAAGELKGKDQFAALQTLGYIPQGSAYVGTDNGQVSYVTREQVNKQIDVLLKDKVIDSAYAQRLKEMPLSQAYTSLNIRVRRYGEALPDIQKSEVLAGYAQTTGAKIEDIKKIAGEIETKGIAPVAAFVTEKQEKIVAQQEQRTKEFKEANTKLPDGQWIDNQQLAGIRNTSPAIYEALTTSGFAAADKIIKEQRDALATLAPYKKYPFSEALMYEAVKSGQYTTEQIVQMREAGAGYEIVKYLYESPSPAAPAILAQAGYSPAVIAQAQLDAQSYTPPVPDTPDAFYNSLTASDKVDLLQAGRLLFYRQTGSYQGFLPGPDIPPDVKEEIEELGKKYEKYGITSWQQFQKLPEETQEKIADMVWGAVSQEKQLEVIETKARGEVYTQIARSVVLGAIPIAGTVIYWNSMPTWAKAVSIVGDALFVSALLPIKPLKWALPGLYEKSEKAVATYNRVTASTIDDALRQLGGVSPDLLDGAKATAQAAAKYADDFTRLKALEVAVQESRNILKSRVLASGTTQFQAVADYYAQTFRELRALRQAISVTRQNLLKAAGQYADDILDKLEPPLAFRSIVKDIPQQLIRRVEAVAVPRNFADDIATLKAQILAKNGEIAQLAAKEGKTVATQKADILRIRSLADDISELKARLRNAQLVDIQKLETQLRTVRELVGYYTKDGEYVTGTLEKALRRLKTGTAQFDELESEIIRLKKLRDTLPSQIAEAYKQMEIDWVPDSIWGGSRGRVTTIDPSNLKTLTGGVTSIELTSTRELPFISAYAATAIPLPTKMKKSKKAPVIEPATVPAPMVSPVPKVVTKPGTGVKPTVKTGPGVSPSEGVTPATGEVPMVGTWPITGIEPTTSIMPAVEPAPAPAPEVAPKTEPTVKITTETTTTTPVPPVERLVPIKVDNPQNKKSNALTEEELDTAVAYPQGFGWWIYYLDKYGKLRKVFHRGQQPPRGVKDVVQGRGEAYRGIQQHIGRRGVSFQDRMGFMQIEVESPEKEPGRTGAIRFTPKRPRITAKRPRIK